MAWVAAILIGLCLPGGGRAQDKEVSFLGFSSDGSVAAWRIDVVSHDPAGRYGDHYTLVRAVDPRTNETLQTFRGSPIRRVGREGGPRRADPAILASTHPKWKRAAPVEAWREVAEQGRFAHEPVAAEERFVIVSDPDVTLEASVEGSTFTLVGEPYGALGFTVAYRSGRLVHLGRFREEGRRGATLSATVRLFGSRSGQWVAVLCRFRDLEGERRLSYGKVAPLPAGPAAAPPGSPDAPVTGGPILKAPSTSLRGVINNYRRTYLEIF